MSKPAGSVRVVRGDITEQDADVIVNAANEHLAHGGGLAAAMVRAGGSIVQEESDAWVGEHGPVVAGTAAVTGAGAMPAKWIVHVVGPRFRTGRDNAPLLKDAVCAALSASADVGARSVAMPAISSGVFGYPTDGATQIIADACRAWLIANPGNIDEIRLMGFGAETAAAFREAVS